MTRTEFLNTVTTMDDIYTFCGDNDLYDIINDYMTQDGLDDHIQYEIGEARDWRRLRDFLNDVPEGYDWYKFNEYGYVVGVVDEDDEVVDLRDAILREMDGMDGWDEEEEEPNPTPDEVFDDDVDDELTEEEIAFLLPYISA